LFDDEDQLGKLVSGLGIAAYLQDTGVQTALSEIAVEYAGLLAQNKVIDDKDKQTNTGDQNGVLYVDEAGKLIADFSPSLWSVNGKKVDIVGQKALVDAVEKFGGTPKSTIDKPVQQMWGGRTDNLIKLVAATADSNITLDAVKDAQNRPTGRDPHCSLNLKMNRFQLSPHN